MCCLLVGLYCCHFHGSWEWWHGGSAGGLCLRGVLKETDLKLLKIRILLLIPTISLMQIGSGSGYGFYKILVSFVFMGGASLSIS